MTKHDTKYETSKSGPPEITTMLKTVGQPMRRKEDIRLLTEVAARMEPDLKAAIGG